MPATVAAPGGWSVVVADGVGRPTSTAAAWGTDADMSGAAIAGVAAVRLLPTIVRTTLVSAAMPMVHYEKFALVAWVKTDSIAGFSKVVLGVTYDAYVGEGTAPTYASSFTYFDAALDAADTWQRLVFIISPAPFGVGETTQVASAYIGKYDSAYTMTIGQVEIYPFLDGVAPMAPSASDTTIAAGAYMYVCDEYECVAGRQTEIGVGAVLEIG